MVNFPRLFRRVKKNIESNPKIALFLTANFFFFYRLFFLPGVEFNSKLWDDEIGWDKEYNQRNPLEWIAYRDAPGYFVFFPRLLFSVIHMVSESIFPTTLRIILILINLMCVYFASLLVLDSTDKPTSRVLVFGAFCSIYIGDLNYLHNIAYYFIFPILYLLRRITESHAKFLPGYFFLIILLINKPIVAILLLLLFAYLVRFKIYPIKPLLFLTLYNIFYLGAYIFLPNRWNTPTNFDLMTLKQLFLNIPWVFGSVLLPIIYFGLNGFLHFLDFEGLRKFLGLLLYVIPVLSITYVGRKVGQKVSIKREFHGLKMSILLLFSSYLLVYINSDSYWIKVFPLYELNVPQDIFLRWSSLIPILELAVFWKISKLLNFQRYGKILFLLVMFQQFIFQIVAYSWLKRY